MVTRLEQRPPRIVLAGIFAAFLLPVLLVRVFPEQLDTVIERSTYLAFHNTAEFFSIMVSLSLFGVGWFSYEQSNDRHALFLGTAFLVVGLLDFMHAMSNAAMPAFITANSTNKSTQFWLAARLFDSSALLASAFVFPDSRSRWLSKWALLLSALAVTGLIFAGIVCFPSYLPATAIPGVGITPLKRFLELLVILLLLCATVAYWSRMNRTGNRQLIYYPAAFVVAMLSEAYFASYRTGFDTYNVLGHIYKVAAFYLIYRGVFVSSINRPYLKLSAALDELRREAVSRSELESEVTERKQAEEKLRASEQREHARAAELQTIFDTAPIGLSIAGDTEGHHIRGNRAVEEMFGLAQGAEFSKAGPGAARFRVIQDGRELAVTELPMQRAIRGETVSGQIIEVVREDGQSLTAFAQATPLFDEVGRPRGAVGAFLDITALKRAEAAVLAAEREKTLILDSASEIIAYHDTENKLIWANKAYLNALGLPLSELKGKKCYQCWGLDRLCLDCPIIAAIRTGQPQEGELTPDTQPHWRADQGSWIVHAAPVKDGKGEIIGAIEMAHNITERRKAERALGESEALLRSLTDNSPDAIYVKDTASRWIMANPAVLSIVRRSVAEALGKTDQELYDDPEIGRAILANDRLVLERGEPVTFEEIVDTPEGRRMYLSVKAPWRDAAGRIMGLIGISRDITERKRAEDELQARNAELAEFNELMVGRELRMIELKREINELCRLIGQPERYPLEFEE